MIPLFKVWMAEDLSRVNSVLRSGYIGQGAVVEEFESRLAERIGSPYVLAVNSGTSALDLALSVIGVGPGDEVISTPMTCSATNHAINNRGAQLVWADIDPISGLISPESIESAISPRTKAIMVVDWGGERVDVADIRRFSGHPIVVDAAHRAPARDDRFTASGSVFLAYSFQAIKFLTTGDGGALVVPERHYVDAKKRRWFGLDRDSSSDFRCSQSIDQPGLKAHMNDIAAAIGLANLEGLDERVSRHWANSRSLGGTSIDGHSWVSFCHVKDRSSFQHFMADRNVASSLVHSRNDRHPVFQGAKAASLRGLEEFDKSYIALPCGWWLSDSEVEYIASSVLEWERLHGKP